MVTLNFIALLHVPMLLSAVRYPAAWVYAVGRST
jgi:hypothetical protein